MTEPWQQPCCAISLLLRSLGSKRIAEIVTALSSFCHQLRQELQHDNISLWLTPLLLFLGSLLRRAEIQKTGNFQTSSSLQNFSLLFLFLRENNSYLLARHSTNVFVTLYLPSTTHTSLSNRPILPLTRRSTVKKKSNLPPNNQLVSCTRISIRVWIKRIWIYWTNSESIVLKTWILLHFWWDVSMFLLPFNEEFLCIELALAFIVLSKKFNSCHL